ncbi:hemolysin family protein [Bacillus sp. FJAT-47783]|uniref:hemolysin family protein n=1 Tax=Bacillus sp. FJAT-47783 TaxID=2922712 RepID=UPI001FAE71C2|nr:hemolysin family protein [Bacillus sp. FJAT-47783]
MELINLLLIILLIALTAFFVASEFAIVKVRRTRIEQLVADGNRNAVAVKRVLDNLDEYLSACQLGITITSLGLGWLGEPTVEHLLHPVFKQLNVNESVASILSFTIAFSMITFLHVVVGELAPKTFAIQKAEQVSLMFSKPLIFFYKLMFPIIRGLNGSARIVSKLMGLKANADHELAHSEDELRIILSESYKSGEINQSEYKYVNNIFTFDDRIAKEIMVPRREIVAFDINDSISDLMEIIKREKYTRFPVIKGDKDHIIGLVNIKEILTDCHHTPEVMGNKLDHYIRPIIRVIESIPIHDLLVKMQRERVHMAILVDEYGGTAGLVTVEDILEEIVGEIQDEFDVDEVPMIQKENEEKMIVDGKVLISEINDLLRINIDDTDVDTIGGWILTNQFEIREGDSISYDHYEFKVLKMEGHQIQLVEILNLDKKTS